jgi:4-hydroxy-4-methyl-2-oxoglutarate aldolase
MVNPARAVSLLASLDTCVISDALDVLGLPGVCEGLRPLWAGASLSGRARTMSLIEVAHAKPHEPGVHLGVHAIEQSEPGDVIVVANSGRLAMGGWGGLLMAAALARGVGGVVVDGACRDADEAVKLEFPVFAAGVTARTARGRVVEHAVDVPVEIGGVAVGPGDYIRADGSGVIVIAADRVDEVLSVALSIASKELAILEQINGGQSLRAALGMNYEAMLAELRVDDSVEAVR